MKAAIEESNQGFTDIVATKAKHKIAVEIETGKSNWRSNIQKNIQSGFKNILILATNQATLQKINQEILEMKSKINIKTISAQEFLELPKTR
jgi:hypothetical protein